MNQVISYVEDSILRFHIECTPNKYMKESNNMYLQFQKFEKVFHAENLP